MDLTKVIVDIPDFPKPGILFRDITPVLEQPAALEAAVTGLGGLALRAVKDPVAAASDATAFAQSAARLLAPASVPEMRSRCRCGCRTSAIPLHPAG